MVFIFRCSCLNISLHLADSPAEIKNIKEYEWFIQKTRWPSLGRADLSMGGVKLQQEKLVDNYDLKETETTTVVWRVFQCRNCDQSLYATNSKLNNHVFVNLGLLSFQQKTVEDLLQAMKRHVFSQAYNIILEENNAASNSLLEYPDEEEVEQFATFKLLQTKLDEHLKEENAKMEQRIEEFIKEQQEQLKQHQAKAFRERKILWNKVCKVNNWKLLPTIPQNPPQSVSTPAKEVRKRSDSEPTKAVFARNIVIIEDYQVNQPIQTDLSGSGNLVVASPVQDINENTSNRKNDVNESQLDKAQALFEFDEEKSEKTVISNTLPETTPKDDLDSDGYEKDVNESKKEESSEEEDNIVVRGIFNVEKQEIKEPPLNLFGTSLPVRIPVNAARSYHPHIEPKQPKKDEEEKEKQKQKDEDLLSKSFDVPVSQNRRINIRM